MLVLGAPKKTQDTEELVLLKGFYRCTSMLCGPLLLHGRLSPEYSSTGLFILPIFAMLSISPSLPNM